MKTLIAVPCMDTVHAKFAEALLNMNKPEGTSVCFNTGSLVYDSRNLLSITAIEQNFDAVLWLDSDIIMPQDTLVRLSQYIQSGADMATGLYFKRTFPPLPVIYDKITPPADDGSGKLVKQIHDYLDYPENASFPVAGCGFGCVMTSVPMLRTLWDAYGPPFNPFPWAGEDISFCYRATQHGYNILCDSSLTCSHIGSMLYTQDLYRKTRR